MQTILCYGLEIFFFSFIIILIYEKKHQHCFGKTCTREIPFPVCKMFPIFKLFCLYHKIHSRHCEGRNKKKKPDRNERKREKEGKKEKICVRTRKQFDKGAMKTLRGTKASKYDSEREKRWMDRQIEKMKERKRKNNLYTNHLQTPQRNKQHLDTSFRALPSEHKTLAVCLFGNL